MSYLTAKVLGRGKSGLAMVMLLAISPVAISQAAMDDSGGFDWPLLFEENDGRFDPSVEYVARGSGYDIALGAYPVIELTVYERSANPTQTDLPGVSRKLVDHALIRLRLQGADEKARLDPEAPSSVPIHVLGGAQARAKSGVRTFRRIRHVDVLPGVDAVYYGNRGRFEYDFELDPGVRPEVIGMRFDGVDELSLTEAGGLVLQVGDRQVVQAPPVAYQVKSGEAIPVEVDYQLDDELLRFRVGPYDRERTLVIDPIIQYSAYFGGAHWDQPRVAGLDAMDNIYVVMTTASRGLATAGAFQELRQSPVRREFVSFPLCPECPDAEPSGQVRRVSISANTISGLLIAKFNPDATQLLSATYFDPVETGDVVLGINSAAVSPAGEVGLGLNFAPDGLPLVNEIQTFDPNQSNGYVARLNAAGDALSFATYLHIGDSGFLRGLDVGADGSVVAVGFLGSFSSPNIVDFPEINPISGQSCDLAGSDGGATDFFDGYVILFQPDGTPFFSSCIGGENGGFTEQLRAVELGADGNIYAAGRSAATDYPVVNAIQSQPGVPGATDAVITVIDPDISAITFSTFYGPSVDGVAPSGTTSKFAQNISTDIVVDGMGNIILAGWTNTTTFPVVNAFQPNLNYPDQVLPDFDPTAFNSPATDLYVVKLHPTNGVSFSTYLGGTGGESGFPKLAVDSTDNIYLFALTESADYPVTNAIQSTAPGETVQAVTKFTPEGAVAFSTYLAGSDSRLVQIPGGIAVNSADQVIVAGYSHADDFPIVGSGTTRNRDADATVAVLDQSGDTDDDGDGVPNAVDAFPGDPGEWRDSDGDGTGDVADADDDDDTVPDAMDRFPLNAMEQNDSDLDGIGDNADAFDADAFNFADIDGDGTADFNDPDTDGDGVADNFDQGFVFDPTETVDNDFDGVGNNADMDDDGDGIDDSLDPAPFNGRDPVETFDGFNPFFTAVFRSPLPDGFSTVAGSAEAWTAASDSADPNFQDTTSLSHPSIGDGEFAGLQFTGDFEAGTLAFSYRVDSEQDADFLRVMVDGVEVLAASGSVNWQEFSMPITAGAHTIIWTYEKDSAVAGGTDAAWIDSLAGFPAPDVDLGVSILSQPTGAGEVSFYTVTAENLSVYDTGDARVQVQLDSDLSNVTWTCAPTGVFGLSSLCGNLAGTGSIDEIVNLGKASGVVFFITATMPPVLADGIDIGANVTVADGIFESEFSNNTAGVFALPVVDVPAATNQQPGDLFGAAVATNGDLVAIGMPNSDEAGPDSGRVVIYRVEGDDVVEEASISVTNAVNFGAALAMDGNRLLVGAPGSGAAAKGTVGALQAAIFERLTGGGWAMKQEFTAISGQADDGFGSAVALDGDVVAIGAPADADGETLGSGAVHVFRMDPDNAIVQSAKLKPDDAAGGEAFGSSVAASGGKLGVGAPGDEVDGVPAGTTTLYQQIAGNLTDLQTIGTVTGSQAGDGDAFGSSIALDGDTVVIGAPGEDEGGGDAGAVYVFDTSGGSATETTRLPPAEPQAGGGFGTAVDISEGITVVGTPGHNGAGAIYRYGAEFEPQQVIRAATGQTALGASVSLEDGVLVGGAPESDSQAGAALVQRNPDLLFDSSFE